MANPVAWLTLGLVLTAQAQSTPPRFSRAYIGADHLAHVITMQHEDRAIPREEAQVAVGEPALSTSGQFAGWTVEVENCCTSYSIPLSVLIYSRAGSHAVGDGLMIYDWCFVPGKPWVAISSGTVHGWQGGPNLHLYSADSGRLINSWHGAVTAKRPQWSHCIKQ